MPYSWDQGHDYDAGGAKGYTFHDARKTYDDLATTTAVGTKTAKYTFKSPFLSTDSPRPLVVGIDTTGSMQEWPRIFFEKLPLLYREAVKYLPECAISFQAINDFEADGAEVALQPAPFGKGPELDQYIADLYPAGGGGGNDGESYEIFAAYNSFLKATKAVIKPIAIILGDEPLFPELQPEAATAYGLGKGEIVATKSVFRKFHATCDAYLVRKPYGDDDEPIIKTWVTHGCFPRERIMTIEDPRRVIDVIIGVIGIITGRAAEFEAELTKRQNADQVTMVMAALKPFRDGMTVAVQVDKQHSKTRGVGSGPKSRGLSIDA